MRLNLNETVKFKLTERGKELYREHFSHLPDCFEQPEPRIDEDGFTEMQLWMFMEMFGEHMSMWKPNVIKPLEIVFDTEDSEACKEQKKVVAQIKVDIDEIVERIKEEYEITEKPVCEDAISRADAINAICANCDIRDCCRYCPEVDILLSLPQVEPPKKVVAQIKVDTDELIERIKEEYEITERPVCEDAISRADTIKAMCRECTQEGYDECREDCTEVAVVKGMPPVEPKRPKGDVRLYIPLDEYTVDRVNRLLKNECGEYFDEEWLYNELEQLAVLYPERPKGKWVRHELWDVPWYTCSECNFHGLYDNNFCPNCGADMRGDK